MKNIVDLGTNIIEYNDKINKDPKNPLLLINRSQLYCQNGLKKLAQSDLKIALALIQDDKNEKIKIQSQDVRNVIHTLLLLERNLYKAEKKVSKLEQSSENNDLFDIFNLIKRRTTETTDAILNKLNNDQSADKKDRDTLEEIRKDLDKVLLLVYKQQVQIEKHEFAIKENKIYEKALVRAKFEDLSNNNSKLYDYCKSFYWTLLNYLDVYRGLSTGLIKANLEQDINTPAKFIQKLVFAGATLARGTPIYGGALGMLDVIVDALFTTMAQHKFTYKVNAINKLILFNKDNKLIFAEDLCLEIAQASLEITEKSAHYILNPIDLESKATNTRWKKTAKWFNKQIEKVKTKFLGEQITLYESPESIAALKDVTLFLTYVYKHWKTMIERQDYKMKDEIVDVITTGKILYVLDQEIRDMFGQKPKKSFWCCMVLIGKYDNPLLNLNKIEQDLLMEKLKLASNKNVSFTKLLNNINDTSAASAYNKAIIADTLQKISDKRTDIDEDFFKFMTVLGDVYQTDSV